ncbi:acyclic terpene utilization AtuA family protein [Streptomyces sp. JJ36]|nr:acyclic terpene utilization AtuA family protein [Streptomyces sp. JJ36]
MRVLAPTAILGYGFPDASFEAGLARRPHVIAVDAGSVDAGPYYLGEGVSFTHTPAVRHDLARLLAGARRLRVPLVIGSAGGAGAAPHLDGVRRIVEEVAREAGLRFRMALVPADVDPGTVRDALRDGRVSPLPYVPELTGEALAATTRVVAQMGAEPLVAALAEGAEVVLAGRAYDPALFAALPLLHGFDPGPALHLAKILECAAIAAEPGSGADCMLGTLRRDHFVVEPLDPGRRCTTASVAAHTLYEKSDPYRLPGPGGHLDLTGCAFEQVTERAVRVSGSRHVAGPYTVKLEGARRRGYRTVCLAGARDPVFLRALDDILESVAERVAGSLPHLGPDDYRLLTRVYGRDGCMGPLEPEPHTGHEAGLVIEAVAETQELADTVCGLARSTLLHHGFPGRMATAGNLAFPYSPSDLRAGPVYEWSVHHLLSVDDPRALFPVHWTDCPSGGPA